ncbi:ABC transporter permease [Streptomyces sp. WMMC897]|uniref:ABC transporter permease n=1 Tax=Streptomyces sp. WMMC897 TaxID=3014782 RepID=UPI0022B5FEB8|nr:ABC transporter permease [Streptomyces sp. WMMC897]MCZ7414706.1 FtsX-like permease family protein [Streptomyces sp. WMMC897]
MTIVRTSLRNFFAHKGRMALSGMAVVLSVAFVCGTLVFTDTMGTTFDKLFGDTAPNVMVSPEEREGGGGEDELPSNGRPDTLPASVVERAGEVEGAETAFGVAMSMAVTVVDGDGENIGPTTGAPTLASNWTELDRRAMKVSAGHPPRGPDEVMVDADTAEKHGIGLGDELRTISVFGEFTSKVSGIAEWEMTNPGAAALYYPTEVVQERLLGGGEVFTSVAVLSADGVTDELLKKHVVAAVEDGLSVQTAEEYAAENQEDVGGFLDVMRYALLGFAGIAVLVGVFLIVNTFSMLVAQRTRELGLMRALGAERRQVGRSVVVEALLLGVVGSLVGIGVGVGIAVGLMELMGLMGMNLSTDDLTIAWTTPVVGLVLGVVVTLLAAWLPARRAGRVSPMAALRDAGVSADGRSGTLRAVSGTVLTVAGTAALVAAGTASEAGPGSMYLALGVLLSLLGFVLVGPLLARVVVRALSVVVLRVWGPVGRLAERNALRNPRRTGATAAALMIGLALVAGLSVVGSSLVASGRDEVDRSVGADFIVTSTGGQPVTPQVAESVKRLPLLEHVTEYRYLSGTELRLPDGERVPGDVSAVSPTYAQDVRAETVEGELSEAVTAGGMSVGEEFATEHGLGVGDRLEVLFPGGEGAELEIRAVTSAETMIDQGQMYLALATAEAHIPRDLMPLNMMMLGTAVEGGESAAYEALKAELRSYPQYEVRDQAEYKQLLEDQVGQLLTMVYGLLALAIIVAVLGVVNTLALSVVERTREIGLLRAVGLSRRQLRRMVRLEAVVIALFGALLGLGLGLAWGVAGQQLLALEGLRTLEIPWPTIVTVFLGSAVVGLLAALVPAFRAGRMNVLNAIATE